MEVRVSIRNVNIFLAKWINNNSINGLDEILKTCSDEILQFS